MNTSYLIVKRNLKFSFSVLVHIETKGQLSVFYHVVQNTSIHILQYKYTYL